MRTVSPTRGRQTPDTSTKIEPQMVILLIGTLIYILLLGVIWALLRANGKDDED